ncbi:MAG: hypothetical protein IAX22_10255 [Candidatus Bathyarchaeota archaeon]|nr:hypothetical protein [Candidatus Bathyarchaeota archaeon]
MNSQSKTKSHKCPYCTPTDSENPCVFATAKKVIDGKEYSVCCSISNNKEINENQKTKEKT